MCLLFNAIKIRVNCCTYHLVLTAARSIFLVNSPTTTTTSHWTADAACKPQGDHYCVFLQCSFFWLRCEGELEEHVQINTMQCVRHFFYCPMIRRKLSLRAPWSPMLSHSRIWIRLQKKLSRDHLFRFYVRKLIRRRSFCLLLAL